VFGLAWFRDKGNIPRLGAGFRLSQASAYRCLDEVIAVLAAKAPGLREALERALAKGTPYVILDGKIVDTDRCHEKTVSRKGAEIDLWYSRKPKDGGNVQALFYPGRKADADLRRTSRQRQRPRRGPGKRPRRDQPVRGEDAGPGRRRLRRRRSRLPHAREEARGDERAGHQRPHQERSTRCLGERGFALLTQRWQILQHVTMSPGKIGQIARAALVLVVFEHKMLTLKIAEKLHYDLAPATRNAGCFPESRP
jgi:hypothetical protein